MGLRVPLHLRLSYRWAALLTKIAARQRIMFDMADSPAPLRGCRANGMK
jgi:hypothetical protein